MAFLRPQTKYERASLGLHNRKTHQAPSRCGVWVLGCVTNIERGLCAMYLAALFQKNTQLANGQFLRG